jgi:hypothetical protein
MRIKLEANRDWEDNLTGTYCIYLNGREVGNEANGVSFNTDNNLMGIKNISVQKRYQLEVITGETKTGKTFEIYGGRKAGGRHTDWWLEVDGVTVCYQENAKWLIQLLVVVEWDDEQIEFSNNLYKKELARRTA